MTTVAKNEAGLKSLIGTVTSRSVVVVERGPVGEFAHAIFDENPIYQTPGAATAAGFAAIPAPPTFSFVMGHWGSFPELQPSDGASLTSIFALVGPHLPPGGLILHGEQSFSFERPIVVGDRLVGTGTLTDAYAKVSGDKTMYFIVAETSWREEKTDDAVCSSRFNVIYRV